MTPLAPAGGKEMRIGDPMWLPHEPVGWTVLIVFGAVLGWACVVTWADRLKAKRRGFDVKRKEV